MLNLPYDILYSTLALFVAAAAGLIGAFALMRKMTLASDAISHIALPGLGLALIFHFNPLFGGAITLLVGACLIWQIEQRSDINTDAVIGVVFAVSLAIGSLLTPEEALVETLLGNATKIGIYEFILGALASLTVIIFTLRQRQALVLMLISKDLAKTAGIDTKKLDLYFLLAFSLTIILGLRYLGVLLMGSLIIIPAAIGRNLAKNLHTMLFVSATAAILAMGIGLIVSPLFKLALGPTIISIAGFLFFLTLIIKNRGK